MTPQAHAAAAAVIRPHGGGLALWFEDGSLLDGGRAYATVEDWVLQGPDAPDVEGGPALYIDGSHAAIAPLREALDRLGLSYRVI